MRELTEAERDVLIEASHPSRPDREALLVAVVERVIAERIAQARRDGAAEALRSAAAEASWMEYPASQDPTHWATWLRGRAADLRGDA